MPRPVTYQSTRIDLGANTERPLQQSGPDWQLVRIKQKVPSMPRFDSQLGPDMTALLNHHRARPEVTFAQHLANLEMQLADEAYSKLRVYLDLNYWIILRDASLGKPRRPEHSKLFEALVDRVDKDELICPVTDSVFFELDRQGNTDRRMDTARLIDRLSKGFVIKTCRERLWCELTEFFEAAIGRRELPNRPAQNVWVKPYSFLGTPQLSAWGGVEDRATNKAFLSYMWSRSLEELLTDTPVPDDSSDEDSRQTAKSITKSSAARQASMRSFAQVLDEETRGLIDFHRAEVFHIFKPYACTLLPPGTNLAMCDPKRLEQAGLDLLYSFISANKPNWSLPLIRILAGLHAFIRWQRNHDFQFNDFFDIRHAAAAIPYCDVFLTEKFFRTACTSNLLDFGKTFGTKIISSEADALDAILQLPANQARIGKPK
jgi:hypothetical protein